MSLIPYGFFIIVLINSAIGERILINDMIDQLLDGISTTIIQQGMDSIHTEDLKHEWKYRWHFIKLRGNLKCTDGKVKKLSTIRRTGDSYFTMEGNRIAISFALGLKKLTIKYKCKAVAKHLVQFHDSITITVGHNSVGGEVSLSKNGESCVASLNRLEAVRLGGVEIQAGGGGPLNKIMHIVLQAVYNHCKGSLLKNISTQMKKIASSQVASQNWCKDIPPLNYAIKLLS